MNNPTAFRALRALLAANYPTQEDARRVVEDAGLNPAYVQFSDKAVNNWHNILTEAEKRGSMVALLQVVLDEYSSNPDLLSAARAYGLTEASKSDFTDKKVADVPRGMTGRAPIKILFLAASPHDMQPLQLSEEVRSIDQSLRLAAFRDQFKFEQHWAVRFSDLQELLLHHQPDIVHFSGHGSPAGEIILESDTGMSHPVSVRALSSLFGVLKDNIRCVVLNACYTATQAQAIAEYIDAVIGTSAKFDDKAAINFASAFYQALGYGRSIKTAFELGCNQIDLANLDEKYKPRLLSLHHDPEEIVFASQPKTDQASSIGGASKYHINIGNAEGLIIGDQARVTQHFGGTVINTGGGPYIAGNVNTGGDFVGRDKVGSDQIRGSEQETNASIEVDEVTQEERRATLQTSLNQHQRNLIRLQAQKAVYALGEEPLRLLNQIAHEEQEIARIQAELQ